MMHFLFALLAVALPLQAQNAPFKVAAIDFNP